MSHQVPTLYDVAFYVLDSVGELYYGTATGGSTTTIIDTELAEVATHELDFKNGTAFITDGGDVAPEGEMSKITSYDHDGGVVTLDATLTSAVASTDKYALADGRFSIEHVIAAVNRALVDMGDIYQMDTSLSTSSTLTRYTLPSGISEGNLSQVWFRNSSVTDREEPVGPIQHRVTPDGELILRTAPAPGRVIELHWNGPHISVSAFSDTIDPAIKLARIVTEATYILINRRLRQTDGEDRQLMRDWNAARSDRDDARHKFPVRKIQPATGPIMTQWGYRGNRRNQRRSSKYGPYLP